MKTKSLLFASLALMVSGCAGVAPVDRGAAAVANSSTGTLYLKSAGSLDVPPGPARFDPAVIAVDARGRLLVGDAARGAVFVYDGSGPPGDVLAEPPSAATAGFGRRFLDVKAIVSTSGLNVYVLDGGAGRVYSYDVSNQLRGTVLDLQSPAIQSEFGRIRAAALLIDVTGQPIIADREGDRLLVFNPHWEPAHAVGGTGTAPGTFRDPVALATDDNGRLIVADRGNRRIQVLSPSGAFLSEYSLERPPESVAADQDGDIFVGDAAGYITILPVRGSRSVMPPPSRSSGPVYVAVSPEGWHLYAARPVAGTVDDMEIVKRGASP